MRLVRIGLGNIDTTVGAFACERRPRSGGRAEMAADDVTVGLFPEQVVGGYPPEDLDPVAGLRRAPVGRSWSVSPERRRT